MNIEKTTSGKWRSASVTLKFKTKASQNEASKLLSLKIENIFSEM